MSLINDALRRASQAERNRPRQVQRPMGMEPVQTVRGSRLSLVLISVVLLALLLACWFFWQWWMVRREVTMTRPVSAAAAPPPVVRVAPAAVPVPAPAPVPAVAPKPVAPPAPVVTAVAAPRTVPPPEIPVVSNYAPTPWPLDLKLNAIFYNKNTPRALVNGSMYAQGEDINGISVKKIEKDKVTFEWNGHTRVLALDGQ